MSAYTKLLFIQQWHANIFFQIFIECSFLKSLFIFATHKCDMGEAGIILRMKFSFSAYSFKSVWFFFCLFDCSLLIKRENEFHKYIILELMCLFPNVDLGCVYGHWLFSSGFPYLSVFTWLNVKVH